MNLKVIDNFLDEKTFIEIKNNILGSNFPWYYSLSADNIKDDVSQLCHVFYNIDVDNRVNSDYFRLLNPIIKKLNAIGLVRIKANLTYPSKTVLKYHTDFNLKNLKTAIFYLNTNDGGTKIKNKIINSVENRMLVMNNDIPHAVIRHTDTKTARVVLVLNYFEGTGDVDGKVL